MDTINETPPVQLSEIDIRLKRLSYSSSLTLHTCPRKYQLYKLGVEIVEDDNVTLAFGHAVGTGIQSTIQGKPHEQVVMDMFLAWDADLMLENTKDKKSFWNAVFAIERFNAIKNLTLLKDYELAYFEHNGELKPAVELSFRVNLPDGFSYIGFVDLVLRHKVTGEFMVLELKTTKFREIDEAIYKNSAQALGYSVILDHLAPHASDYKVMYLVYKSTSREIEPFFFNKSFTQRALWLRQLLLDVELIRTYDEISIFPMYGESCFNYFRRCEYYGICHMETSRLVQPISKKQLDSLTGAVYIVDVSVDEVIEALLHKQELTQQPALLVDDTLDILEGSLEVDIIL